MAKCVPYHLVVLHGNPDLMLRTKWKDEYAPVWFCNSRNGNRTVKSGSSSGTLWKREDCWPLWSNGAQLLDFWMERRAEQQVSASAALKKDLLITRAAMECSQVAEEREGACLLATRSILTIFPSGQFSGIWQNHGSSFNLIINMLDSSSLLIFVFLVVMGLISLTSHTTCTLKYLWSLLVHRNGVEVNVFVNLDL